MPNEITDAAARSAKATKASTPCAPASSKRTRRAPARSPPAATEAVTANRDAAEAWDAVATHAATHAAECRHGADLADRTRRRWAHSV